VNSIRDECRRLIEAETCSRRTIPSDFALGKYWLKLNKRLRRWGRMENRSEVRQSRKINEWRGIRSFDLSVDIGGEGKLLVEIEGGNVGD
jgi:hypothetical protein